MATPTKKEIAQGNVARNYRKLSSRQREVFKGTPTETTGKDPFGIAGQTGNPAEDYGIQRSQEKAFTESHSMEDIGDFGEEQRTKRYP